MKTTRIIMCLLLSINIFSTMASVTTINAEQLSPFYDVSRIKNSVSVEICSLFRKILWEEFGYEKYPNDFAGAYINDENSLVLVFTHGNSDKYKFYITKEMIRQIIYYGKYMYSLSESTKNYIEKNIVSFVEKTFSYNYLIELQRGLNNVFLELDLIKTALNERTNTVDIYLKNWNSKDNVCEYLKKMNYSTDAVAFYKSDSDVLQQMSPGNRIVFDKTGARGTIGFNAIYNDEYGIVTNSHLALIDETIKFNNIVVGQPSFSIIDEITYNKSVDVAFIPFPDQASYAASQMIDNDVIITSTGRPVSTSIISDIALRSELILGADNYKYGVSTERTIGKITSTCVSIYVGYGSGGRVMCDVISYSNNGDQGDSGGPFGMFSNDTLGRYYIRLMGINFAGVNNGEGNSYGIKLSNIMEIEGLYPITNNTLFCKYR